MPPEWQEGSAQTVARSLPHVPHNGGPPPNGRRSGAAACAPSAVDASSDAAAEGSSASPPSAGAPPPASAPSSPSHPPPSLPAELRTSFELIFSTRLTYLLAAGPPALLGSSTGWLSESTCFALAGLAIIPCAERLSYVTEQVAAHTNGTIGALLNATFGNAPEFLISSAALRAGFYRVVQLALLGSVLTNLLFVFGLSCLVGGMRWQVQELRVVSGNVAVGMLFLSTAGLILPATLIMTGQVSADGLGEDANTIKKNKWEASADELGFSRFNSLVMVGMYVCYLTFQLGTHSEEFSDTEEQHDAYLERVGTTAVDDPFGNGGWRRRKARRNLFCKQSFTSIPDYPRRLKWLVSSRLGYELSPEDDLELGQIKKSTSDMGPLLRHGLDPPNFDGEDESANEGTFRSAHPQDRARGTRRGLPGRQTSHKSLQSHSSALSNRGRGAQNPPRPSSGGGDLPSRDSISSAESSPLHERRALLLASKDRHSDRELESSSSGTNSDDPDEDSIPERTMSFRCGMVWLLLVTMCISSMSDILVDTIDGFAQRYSISEVFTSVVIIPFFSNIAEQVSAVLFAYRNEMDLCVGVTVGSAVQIANFVIPGCVLVGWAVDRSLSLYFQGYETCCLLIGVLCVSAVLQGGTTNWLVGMFFVGVYLMVAAGFWFHEVEDLSVDAEEKFRNATGTVMTFKGSGAH